VASVIVRARVCVLAAGLSLAPSRVRAESGPEVPATNREGKTTDRSGVPIDQLTPVPTKAEAPGPARPAYQLYWEVDGPLFTIAVVAGIGRFIRGGLAPAFCAPVEGSITAQSDHCDPATLNWVDRRFAGRYRPGWTPWSDIGLYGLEALAAAGILVDEGLRAGLNDLVVVAEATLMAQAASGISTAVTGRPRPYMYGTEASMAVRQSGDGGLSYFSGHTSTAFGLATSTFVTLRRLHPDHRWPWLVLAGGGVAATLIGATRVLAGSHFPTDVLAGAAVGTAFGLLVPALHRAPTRLGVAPMPVASGGGLSLSGALP
jgi:membrane-associated phospholipid phosphatase